MFTFRSKRFFSQGSVLQFWGVLVSHGEKIGYISVLLPRWLSLFSQLFKQSPPQSPEDSESDKLHAPEPLIALDQLRVISKEWLYF